MPPDALIVLCYFVALMDSAMHRVYPGELERMQGGGSLLKNAMPQEQRGRFSWRHVAAGVKLEDGISASSSPVLHIVTGATEQEVHCRLLLNDVAYDPALQQRSAQAANGAGTSRAGHEPDTSMWRTMALLLLCMQRLPSVAAHFESFPGLQQAVLRPVFQGNHTQRTTRYRTYDDFM
jgi:hypothetical protein